MKNIKNMVKGLLSLALVALGTNAWATSNGATSAGDTTGSFSENNHTYTVTGTKYINPSGNDSANRNERGWYAGIKITWNSKTQKASSTTAAVTDNLNAHNVDSFTIYGSLTWQNSRAGSGLSDFGGSTYWTTMYVTKATWWAHITPEDAYKLNGADYTATLTIGGETFKIVIPATTYNAGLVDDSSVKWFPAVALIGSKVYGDLNVAIKTWGTVNCVADSAITEAITVEPDSTLVLNKGAYTITGLENLSIKGGTYDFDPSAYVATGYKAYQDGDVWKIKVDHKHSWTYAVATEGNVVTLTATCVNPDCTLPSPYQTSATLTLSSGDKAYDGQAITAELAKGEFETLTGITLGGVECTGNATDVGTYKFSVSAEGTGCDFGKSVTISQRDISDVVITLSATSLPYSGTEQTVTISSVTAGGLTVTYTEDTDSVRTAKAIGSYTVKITATGNFTGSATKGWSITNYSGSLKSLASAETGVGTIENNTLTVTDSSKLYYDAANQIWYVGLTLTWDWSTKDYYWTDYGYAIFTKPSVAQMTIGDTTYTGEQSTAFDGGKIDNATATLTYKKNVGNEKTCTYLNTTTFSVAVTPAIIAAAKEAGVITGTMYAGAFPFSESDDTQRSSGIAFQNYTINIPIDENLKLYDEVGNQVYPDAGYVAQVADTKLKYTTLSAAIGAATVGQTVNAIAACEKADFTVGANVTVNLAGFGASGATYKLGGDLDNMNAKVTSSKQETVTTEATSLGIETTESEGTYTYSLKYVHVHNWKWTSEDGRLYADCQAESCDHNHIEITLTGSDATYDATAHACTLSDTTDFTTHSGYAVGSIVYKKNGEVVESATDAGSYVAEVTCTKEGAENKTLTKSFTIAPAEISEMTLSATSLYYTAAEQSVSVTSVKANGVEAKDFVTVSGDTSATSMGQYTVTVTANNANFTGSKSATWSIVNTPTTSGGGVSGAAVSGGVTAESATSFTVPSENSKSLEYVYDTSTGTHTWWATIKLTYAKQFDDCDYVWEDYGYGKYTHPTAAKFTVDGTTYTVDAAKNAGGTVYFAHSMATVATASGSYKYSTIKSVDYYATDTISYRVGFSLGEAEAAIANNQPLTFTINAGAIVDTTTAKPHDSTTFYSVAFQDYTVTIPVNEEGYKLYDQYGNQIYPAVNYVAQVGNLKYTTLGEAIGAATAELPANAIAACEKADFTVGANVTVNLAGFGASGATYKLGGDLDNMNAKVTSSKEETVTTDATSLGIETTVAEGTYTYSLKYVHVHNWKWTSEDGKLSADCTAESCDHNHIEITLTGSDVSYDSKAHGCTLSDTTDFTTHSGYAVGGITYYTRDGATLGDALEGAPVNVGTYAAVVVCTKDGCESQTLRKDYSITQAAMSSVSASMTTASFEYDGTERSNSIGSAKLGDYSLSTDDYDLTGIVKSYGSGYSNETYTVTLTGKGNFTGTQTTTWTITAPTVEFDANPLTATTIGSYTTGYATCEGKTLTVTDSTLLPFNGGWYAGFVIAYPYSIKTAAADSQVTDPAYLRFRNSICGLSENQYYTGTQIQSGESALTAISTDEYKIWWRAAGDVTYVKNLTWWAPVITPAVIEQAAAEEKTELSYVATLGGIKWSSSGYAETTTFKGVKFADFTIKVPFGDGIVLKVPEATTYDLGATVLNKCSLNLAKDAVVTTTVEQAEGKIFTTETGFQIYSGTEGGVTTYACWTATEYVTVPDVANATKVVKVGEEVKEPTEEGGNIYAVLYGDTVTITYTPNSGYETSDGTKTIENVTSNVTLTDLPTITATTYTIAYELDGGENDPSNPTSYTIESEKITLAAPTKTDYNFLGWTPDNGVIAAGSTGDKTFTATWKYALVTITVPAVANTTNLVTVGEGTLKKISDTSYEVTAGQTVTVTYFALEGYLPKTTVATLENASEGATVPTSGVIITQAAAMVVPHEGATTNYYATVKEAIEAVQYEGLVALCRDASGDGIVITADKNFAFDLGGYTYTVTGNPVGSKDTETNGFQILAGAEVDIKNGTITSAKGSGVKILIQNYATLLVNGATLDGRNLDGEGKVYTLSNNNGFTQVIAFGEVIARGEGDIAMDACTFGAYDGTEVRLDGGKITGDIEVSWYAGTKPTHTVELDLVAGIVTGKIVMDPTAENANVAVVNSGSVSVEIPAGYKWNSSGNLVKKLGTIYFVQ